MSTTKAGSVALFLMSICLSSALALNRCRFAPTHNSKGVKPAAASSAVINPPHRKNRNSLVEVLLPAGSLRMQTVLTNDDVISKAVKETGSFLQVVVYTSEKGATQFAITEYVSSLYSRVWDEMIQSNNLGLETVVVGDYSNSDSVFKTTPVRLLREDIDGYYGTLVGQDKSILASLAHLQRQPSMPENITVTEILIERPDEKDITVTFFDDINPGVKDYPRYNHLALGGSFDHLHNGHRKLLYLSVCCCVKELTIGVTGDTMLAGKSNAKLIDPYAIRAKRVTDFIGSLNPSLKLNVVELQDPFGPTITNPNIDAIIVSSETIPGAKKINMIRQSLPVPMRPLSILVTRRSDGAVLSSTFIRTQMANKCPL